MRIKNLEIAEYHKKINRFVIEVEKDDGSALDGPSPFAIDRMLLMVEYMSDAVTRMSISSKAETVEISGRFHDLVEPHYAGDITNGYHKTCCNILEVIRDEMAGYQSANRIFGLMPWDTVRAKALVEEFAGYVKGLKTVKPLDLPKTTTVINGDEQS